MTVKTPKPPPLPVEVDRLLRRLRMPYVRRAAPGAVATAQRWEPAESGGCCWPRKPRAATKPRSACAAANPGCPPARPSTPCDEDASPIPKPTRYALRTLEWLARAEGLCVCGRSGTGKSRLVEALGHLAKIVAWHTLESLVMLRRHRADDTVSRAIGPLIRADLIVINRDPPGRPGRRRSAVQGRRRRHEKRSIALTSNIHAAGSTS